MLTPFGREVRKFRIDQEMTLSKMADELEVSPAFLTAVETGKKPIPANFPARIAAVLRGTEEVMRKLVMAADASRSVHKIVLGEGHNNRDREVAALFARTFSGLSDQTKTQIQEILEKEQGV